MTTSPPQRAPAASGPCSPRKTARPIPHPQQGRSMSQPQNQPVFSIEKVYVKDLSLEIPNAPQAFLEREAPTVDIQLHHNTASVEDGIYQTVLTVTVTAKVAERTLFLVEVGQAGIFSIRNVPANELDAILGIACPNILFPYAREVISDVVTRAGFPP